MTAPRDFNPLRTLLRAQRQKLTEQQQQTHQQAAIKALSVSGLIKPNTRVAVYLAQDGELGCDRLIEWLWAIPCSVYLPIIDLANKTLSFGLYQSRTRLAPNKFGILEPIITRPDDEVNANQCDSVLVPLVGFDAHGNRLGMGGGFYDRSFAFKCQQPNAKPIMIGWAHACQQVEKLDSQPWDVPLNAIITEQGVNKFVY